MNENNELKLVDSTVSELTVMIEESVKFQAKVSPVYQTIANKILGMLNKQEELDNWEVKDLLKLLELSNKAQLAPVEQLTKLVQSVSALYERGQLHGRVDELAQLVQEIKDKKEEVESSSSGYVASHKDIEDVELDEDEQDS